MLGKIKIDDRESDFVFNGFIKETIEYEKMRLDIGDFQCGEVIFEHKTVEDFVQSFQSGHLNKQLSQQEVNFKYSFLIISGDFDRLFFNQYIRGVGREQITGMLASIYARFPKTKIVQTITISRVFKISENRVIAQMCKKIAEKCQDGKVLDIHNTELMRSNMKTEDFQLKMLCCCPGISIKKGQAILARYSLLDLYKVDEGALCEIEGIGKVLAGKIKGVFSSPL